MCRQRSVISSTGRQGSGWKLAARRRRSDPRGEGKREEGGDRAAAKHVRRSLRNNRATETGPEPRQGLATQGVGGSARFLFPPSGAGRDVGNDPAVC